MSLKNRVGKLESAGPSGDPAELRRKWDRALERAFSALGDPELLVLAAREWASWRDLWVAFDGSAEATHRLPSLAGRLPGAVRAVAAAAPDPATAAAVVRAALADDVRGWEALWLLSLAECSSRLAPDLRPGVFLAVLEAGRLEKDPLGVLLAATCTSCGLLRPLTMTRGPSPFKVCPNCGAAGWRYEHQADDGSPEWRRLAMAELALT